jgi:hypothetical protein
MGRRGGLIHDILEQQCLREAVSIIPHENQNIVLGERPRLLSPDLLAPILQFQIITQIRGAITTLVIAS